jgi:hypothetical protein
MTEYYTASRRGIEVSYECDDCGEGWTVEYATMGDVPPEREVPCPTPNDHDDYYCPGGCGCVAEEGCDCCTCSCEEGTRGEGCRNAWHTDEDGEAALEPSPTQTVPAAPTEGLCTCPECVKVRDLWKQSRLVTRFEPMTEAAAILAIDHPVKPPEDKWAHLRPDAK